MRDGIRLCTISALLLWLLLLLPRFSLRVCYEVDTSNFIRAMTHYDVSIHQPHPPGYALWILAARGVRLVFADAVGALSFLAMLFSIAALFLFWRMAREMAGPGGAWVATALLAYSPVVSLYAAAPLSYASDMFASVLVASLCARIWRGDLRCILFVFAALAVAAGIRQSSAVFLAPLVAYTVLRAGRPAWPGVLGGILLAAALTASWYLPMLYFSGGRAGYDRAMRQNIWPFRNTSLFFGASPRQHLYSMVENALYLSTALAVFLLLALLARRRSQGDSPPSWFHPAFFAAWLLPNFIQTFLVHAPKAGYQMLVLPPLVLLLVWRARGLLARHPMAVLWGGVVVSLALSYAPYRPSSDRPWGTIKLLYLRSTPRIHYMLEQTRIDLTRQLKAFPPGTRIVNLVNRPEAPAFLTARTDFPHYRWSTRNKGELVELHAAAGPADPSRFICVWQGDLASLWIRRDRLGSAAPSPLADGR
jgi:hypothetical protein